MPPPYGLVEISPQVLGLRVGSASHTSFSGFQALLGTVTSAIYQTRPIRWSCVTQAHIFGGKK